MISPERKPRRNIEELIEMAGNSHDYQRNILILFILQFLFSSFIEMGFPIIFRDAVLLCPDGTICDELEACKYDNPALSPTVQSVAYTFNLVCERKSYLDICFNAFLYGGFFGCLYYGEIQERKGRKYVVHESMAIMILGIVISFFSGNITLFSIGAFLINFGFRGFYNAAVLTLTEVSSETSRMTFPIFLHMGWAVGQVAIAVLGLVFVSWRSLFFLTAVPLICLFVYGLRIVKESPRSLVVKMQFQEAKRVVEEIAEINGKQMKPYELEEEKNEVQNLQGFQNLVEGEEIVSNTKHYSYLSLFRFNSIRIRVFIIAYIWSVISLSYFCSASNKINQTKGLNFNLALAGALEIIGYLLSAWICLNMMRIDFIRKLCIYGGVIHLLFYFVSPLKIQDNGFLRVLIMLLDMLTRISMSMGNVFFVVYSVEVFPTCVRHFAIGLLGFATKFVYMAAPKYYNFWKFRGIHPNFVIGLLLIGATFTVHKLRETKGHFKDNLDEDESGRLMTDIRAGLPF